MVVVGLGVSQSQETVRLSVHPTVTQRNLEQMYSFQNVKDITPLSPKRQIDTYRTLVGFLLSLTHPLSKQSNAVYTI